MGQHRRKYTDDYKAAAVERLYEPGATQSSVSSDLGITGTQLKTWRLEIEAFGSVEAKRRQQADAAELARLRKDNRRLAGEVEILHKASAFFATRAVKPSLSWLCCANHFRATDEQACFRHCPESSICGFFAVQGSADIPFSGMQCPARQRELVLWLSCQPTRKG
jgi:transposase